MTTPGTEIEAVFQNGSFHPINAPSEQWIEGQHVRLVVQNPSPNEEVTPVQPRIAGLHAGLVSISDDFNDPL